MHENHPQKKQYEPSCLVHTLCKHISVVVFQNYLSLPFIELMSTYQPWSSVCKHNSSEDHAYQRATNANMPDKAKLTAWGSLQTHGRNDVEQQFRASNAMATHNPEKIKKLNPTREADQGMLLVQASSDRSFWSVFR